MKIFSRKKKKKVYEKNKQDDLFPKYISFNQSSLKDTSQPEQLCTPWLLLGALSHLLTLPATSTLQDQKSKWASFFFFFFISKTNHKAKEDLTNWSIYGWPFLNICYRGGRGTCTGWAERPYQTHSVNA